MKLDKLIINVALTGTVHNQNDNPNLPVAIDEIVTDCYRCYCAGASVFHIHARDENGKPDFHSARYAKIIAKVREKCPDAIICVSTSGRVFKLFEQRSEVLDLNGKTKPDMASLTLGSFNFPGQVSMNEPDIIRRLAEKMYQNGIAPELEIFDLGMIDYAKYLIEKKILQKPLYCNFLLGSLGTISASPFHLATLVNSLPLNSVWAGAGIGRFQFYVNAMSITMGGHVRVGLEDNLYLDIEKKQLATNLELVERLVKLAHVAGREICTPGEARNMIGLPRFV
ncbi:MAG: 3-keto-5-aminohexanoate cleavage protein [Planctomycetes bacterium]|nr:3-keto-5-aminohexanoate cleavage protein [Planctomycetota bacterium]